MSFPPIYTPTAADFIQSRGGGSFKQLAGCRMPPPCMEGYSQFRMPGTDTMCCRKTQSKAGRKRKPCKARKVRSRVSGRCVLRKNLKKARAAGPPRPRVPKPGAIDMRAAKASLRNTFAQLINGKLRAPGFITTLAGVTGRTPADKIANLRRVLSACKRAGIPLLKKTGRGFKSYRTLITQCNVRMTSPTAGGLLSERVGGTTLQRALAKFKANRGTAPVFGPAPALEGYEAPDEFVDTPSSFDEFGRRMSRFGRLRFGARRYF